jgi:hypothetical protein
MRGFKVVAALVLFCPSYLGAQVLTFEGLDESEAVEDYYDGGTGGNGSGPGPDYGIVFSPNALATIDADQGGGGNFGGEPSPDTVLFFLTGDAATMNVAAGFTTGFSFFYSAINQAGSITVYDGVDATGNVLAMLSLPLTPNNGAPDPTGAFSPLLPIGVSFSGTARSVDFAGTINQIGFDNITLGSATPEDTSGPDAPEIPTLGSVGLVALILSVALTGFALLARRR